MSINDPLDAGWHESRSLFSLGALSLHELLRASSFALPTPEQPSGRLPPAGQRRGTFSIQMSKPPPASLAAYTTRAAVAERSGSTRRTKPRPKNEAALL